VSTFLANANCSLNGSIQRLGGPPGSDRLAVDEIRRAEFFRKGGPARELVKGKRWLLLTRWLHLTAHKKQQLNELFALNRRVM
jgi:hypothetical protein